MDFLKILSYVLAVVETGTLFGALIYIAQALREKKIQRTQQGKKGGKSKEAIQKAVATYYRNAAIFGILYLVLNVIRRYSGLFE